MRATGKPFNIEKKQVYEAYKAVKSKAGGAGVDGQTIEQFESDLKNNLYKIWNNIGAGGNCDGQVLVMHDMLGINTEFKPRFLRQYLNMHEQITTAVKQYITDVKTKDFPNEQEQY